VAALLDTYLQEGASAATRCRDLLILTRDGTPPPARLVPTGPAVGVQPVSEWLLDAR
jgi:hypothetical protein